MNLPVKITDTKKPAHRAGKEVVYESAKRSLAVIINIALVKALLYLFVQLFN
jgi:hypothetical protein